MKLTPKEYLRQVKKLDILIDAKIEQCRRLREQATKATGTFTATRVSDTPNRSLMADAVEKLIDLEAEINADIAALVNKRREVAACINAVKKYEYRELLELRYLNYKTWDEIAEIMGYGRRHITRMHGESLKHVLECPT